MVSLEALARLEQVSRELLVNIDSINQVILNRQKARVVDNVHVEQLRRIVNQLAIARALSGVESEIFLVMTNRKDGALPGIEKTIDMRIHWNHKDAEESLKKNNEEIGPYFGIYRALIQIVEKEESLET